MKKKLRRRKIKGGGTDVYDYKRYKEINLDDASDDYRQLASRIDQQKTDIAALAREVFPNHKVIRLTESDLHSIVRNLVNKILKESYGEPIPFGKLK